MSKEILVRKEKMSPKTSKSRLNNKSHFEKEFSLHSWKYLWTWKYMSYIYALFLIFVPSLAKAHQANLNDTS